MINTSTSFTIYTHNYLSGSIATFRQNFFIMTSINYMYYMYGVIFANYYNNDSESNVFFFGEENDVLGSLILNEDYSITVNFKVTCYDYVLLLSALPFEINL